MTMSTIIVPMSLHLIGLEAPQDPTAIDFSSMIPPSDKLAA